MSDRTHWELHGPVRSVDLQRTWRDWKRGSGDSDACELTENGDRSIAEFRPDGAISRRWHHNPDGSEWTTVHVYDDAGRLISVRNDAASGQSNLGLYEYDPTGRPTRHLSRDAAGNERTIERYPTTPKASSLIYPRNARTQTIVGASKEAKHPTPHPTPPLSPRHMISPGAPPRSSFTTPPALSSAKWISSMTNPAA